MNRIENIWGLMEMILKRDYEHPANSDELFEEIWIDLMTNEQYRKTVISFMISCILAMKNNKGGYTSY